MPFRQICSPCPNFFLTVEAYLELRVMFLDKYSVTRQNQAYLICLIAEKKLRTKYGQQSRYDSWGARGEGARGVPNGTSQGPHWLCEEQHSSPDQLQVKPRTLLLSWGTDDAFRNNKKLLGRVKAFDRHCNMVLEGVKEMWTELPKTGKGEFSWHFSRVSWTTNNWLEKLDSQNNFLMQVIPGRLSGCSAVTSSRVNIEVCLSIYDLGVAITRSDSVWNLQFE